MINRNPLPKGCAAIGAWLQGGAHREARLHYGRPLYIQLTRKGFNMSLLRLKVHPRQVGPAARLTGSCPFKSGSKLILQPFAIRYTK